MSNNTIKFTKMHGLGNDFVVINAVEQPFTLSAKRIAELADRHTGVGFDQMLIVDPPPSGDVDFGYRIFNADGGEVEQCGNGARCFAVFAKREGLTDKNELVVKTKTTIMQMKIINDDVVSVSMGAPNISDQQIAIDYPHTILSIGNPHIVLQAPELSTSEIAAIGKDLQTNSALGNGVNVGFVQHLDRQNIVLRVYERGAGETQACGTGACAAVVAGIYQGKLDSTVNVKLLGGTLDVSWGGDEEPVWLTGPAVIVYDGDINV